MQSPGRKSKSAGPELNETAFMLRICDILNFARMQLVKIIEMGFTPDTPIRTAIADYPADAFQGWYPWSMNIGRSASRPESNLPMISNDRLRKRHVSKWIIDGLASDYHFEDIFVELSDEFIIINQYLRRDRFASRMLADIAEIYIARGDYEAAIPHLLKSMHRKNHFIGDGTMLGMECVLLLKRYIMLLWRPLILVMIRVSVSVRMEARRGRQNWI